MSTVLETLRLLDLEADELWTADGLPRVDVVSNMLGAEVTRQQITDAAPQFSRHNPDGLPDEEEQSEPVMPQKSNAQSTMPKMDPDAAEVSDDALLLSVGQMQEMSADELEALKTTIGKHQDQVRQLVEFMQTRSGVLSARMELIDDVLTKYHDQNPMQDYLASSLAERSARVERVERLESALGLGKKEIEELVQ